MKTVDHSTMYCKPDGSRNFDNQTSSERLKNVDSEVVL